MTLKTDKSTYPLSDTVTFTASATNASYYSIAVTNSSGSTVHSNSNFSKTTTWKPTSLGTYTARVTAYNGTKSASSSSVTFTVYDATPATKPELTITEGDLIVGQTITIDWDSIKYATNYQLVIKKGSSTVYNKAENDCKYTGSLDAGVYTAYVTASNPYGSTTSESLEFTVNHTTAQGSAGSTVNWYVDTATGVFALSGTGLAVNENENNTNKLPPWYVYAKFITTVDISEGITNIPLACFYEFTEIREYDIPESITHIEDWAFGKNTALQTFTISKSIESIGNNAFSGCSSLTSVDYYPKYESITDSMYAGNIFVSCHKDLIVSFLNGSTRIGDEVTSCGFTSVGVVSIIGIFFHGNGGTLVEPDSSSQSHPEWQMISYYYTTSGNYSTYNDKEIPAFYWDGFVFKGWYTEPEGGRKIDLSEELLSSNPHKLYAQWEPETFEIEFNAGIGESQENSMTADYWSTYDNLPDATVPSTISDNTTYEENSAGVSVQTSGYEFDGWYTAEYGGVEVTDDSIVELDQTQQLYAQWIDRTVRFESATIIDGLLGYDINSTAESLDGTLKIYYYDDESILLGEESVAIDLVNSHGTISLNSDYDFDYCSLALVNGAGEIYDVVDNVYVEEDFDDSSGDDGTSGNGSSNDSNSSSNSSSSSSSSSSSTIQYFIYTQVKDENGEENGGSISTSKSKASSGTEISVIATPDEGYYLKSLTVLTNGGGKITTKLDENNNYTFTLRDDVVTVTAIFSLGSTASPEETLPEQEQENPTIYPEQIFYDVKTTDWYYSYVKYALENGLMSGMGDYRFAPDEDTLRSMIVTVLHSIAEKPNPVQPTLFNDVTYTDYYFLASLWASEEGIVSGVGDNNFGGSLPVTREAICTMIYKYALTQTDLITGPAYASSFADGTDINVWAQEAVNWCSANKIVNGYEDGTFKPQASANRGEIATMLTKFSMLIK